jgi:hypothetical protein
MSLLQNGTYRKRTTYRTTLVVLWIKSGIYLIDKAFLLNKVFKIKHIAFTIYLLGKITKD